MIAPLKELKERLYFVREEVIELVPPGVLTRATGLLHTADVVIERTPSKNYWRCIKHVHSHYLDSVCHPNWIKLLFSEFHVYSLTPPFNLDTITICQNEPQDWEHKRGV